MVGLIAVCLMVGLVCCEFVGLRDLLFSYGLCGLLCWLRFISLLTCFWGLWVLVCC